MTQYPGPQHNDPQGGQGQPPQHGGQPYEQPYQQGAPQGSPYGGQQYGNQQYGNQHGQYQQQQPAYGGPGGAPQGYQTSEEKTWALIAHFGGIIFGFIPALIVFLVKGPQSPTVRAHSVAALNFQIVVSGALIILGIVGFCGGFFLPSVISWLLSLLSTAVWIGGVIFAIIAGLKANQGQVPTYPIPLTLVK